MEKKYNFNDGLKLGVKVIINTWPVLQFAIENGLAQQNSNLIKSSGENYKSKANNKYSKSDKEIKEDLIDELYQFCLDFQVEEIDVEDFLLDYMDQHFFTVVEDNSEKLIAKFIINLIKDLEKDSNEVLQDILEKCEKLSGIKIEAMIKSDGEDGEQDSSIEEYSDEDEEEEEEETEEEKQKREELEADGWAVAGTQNQTKSKKSKKNKKKNSDNMDQEELDEKNKFNGNNQEEEQKNNNEEKQQQQDNVNELNKQMENNLNVKE